MRKYLIGIDLGGTNIKSSIFTSNFEKVAEYRMSTQAEKGSEIVLLRILESIQELFSITNINASEILCIGIGVPGLLDNKTGISKFSPNFPKWENVHVSEWFESKLRIPTFIDNDVRMNLYGEWYFGAGKGKRNVVLITLGTGLGSGVIVDGKVLYGATGSIGEIGHMNMYRSGRECRCGSSGCLGRYVSAIGILRTLREKMQDGEQSVIYDWINGDYNKITAKMVSEAFDKGDAVAINTLHETGEVLGYALVNIINLYNPECIIIGGGVSLAGERLLKSAREIVERKALQISKNACEIVTSLLGDASGILGAAIYAKNIIGDE
ncbi:ROK family protein [Clostridium nigeriense]|uniref:ROK family protein n=1 Tax=Clostridium nigeriense TaxID=1805470 RepID=UPI00082E635E|nr:ROK family protein [Clostridium nigeriense]